MDPVGYVADSIQRFNLPGDIDARVLSPHAVAGHPPLSLTSVARWEKTCITQTYDTENNYSSANIGELLEGHI